MERMGGILVPDELNGLDVHRLENVMTLEAGVHLLFDDLKLFFESVGRNDYLEEKGTDSSARLARYHINIAWAPQTLPYIFQTYHRPSLSPQQPSTCPFPTHITLLCMPLALKLLTFQELESILIPLTGILNQLVC